MQNMGGRSQNPLSSIPMNTDMFNFMLELKKNADKKGVGNPENYVFCLPDGMPISRYRVSIELEKIQTRMSDAGFEFTKFTCHALRHTYAIRAIENGINPQNLKSLLGH